MGPPAGTTDAVEISAGYRHDCLLTASGEVICWGESPLIPAYARRNQVAITTGNTFTCSLSSVMVLACYGGYGYANGVRFIPAPIASAGVPISCLPTPFSRTSSSPSASPTPGHFCSASLFRALPFTDLSGTRMSVIGSEPAPSWFSSENSCRVACCSAAGCQGYSFALFDSGARLGTPVACFLFSNVTQLIPSSFASSGLLSSLL